MNESERWARTVCTGTLSERKRQGVTQELRRISRLHRGCPPPPAPREDEKEERCDDPLHGRKSEVRECPRGSLARRQGCERLASPEWSSRRRSCAGLRDGRGHGHEVSDIQYEGGGVRVVRLEFFACSFVFDVSCEGSCSVLCPGTADLQTQGPPCEHVARTVSVNAAALCAPSPL